MAKIVLDTVTGGYDLSVINNNFDKIETELQNKVLYRDNPTGEPNTLVTDVDANGKRIYNLPEPLLNSEAARLQDIQNAVAGAAANLISFTPYGHVAGSNVQAAIQELIDDTTNNGVTLPTFLKDSNALVVDNIVALKAINKTKFTKALVLGYYAKGDGGGGVFWFDSADTTSSDNLGTIIVATDGGRWKRDFSGPVNVRWFGAVLNGVIDDTAAIQSAFTVGQSVFIPEGTAKISAALVTPSGQVRHVFGNGMGSTYILQTSATADGIQSLNPAFVSAGSIRNLSIIAGSTIANTGDGSSGVGISIRGANGNFDISNVEVRGFATSLRNDGSFYLRLSNFQFLYFKTAGLHVSVATGSAGASNYYGVGKISNFGYTGAGTTSVGVLVEESGGEFFEFIDVTSANEGIKIKPPTGKQVAYQFFSNVLADTSVADNWVIDASLGNITSVQCDSCWGAFSTNGSGLVTIGSGLDGLLWADGRLRENGKYGVNLKGGVNVQINGGHINKNSKLTTNTYSGVLVDAGVSQWAIEGSRIGNFGSGLAHEQAEAIVVSTGASDNYRVLDNDLRLVGTGKVHFNDGGSGFTKQIDGNLPLQNVGLNLTRGQVVAGTTIGTVAAATTTYLGSNAQQAIEDDTFVLMSRPGVISKVRIEVQNAPGASQSFTYTVRVNGADTALTGSITGAAAFSLGITGGVTVSENDRVSIKLITSATAAVSRHRFSITIDG